MIVFQFEAKLAMYVFLYDGLFVIKLPTLGNFNIIIQTACVSVHMGYLWFLFKIIGESFLYFPRCCSVVRRYVLVGVVGVAGKDLEEINEREDARFAGETRSLLYLCKSANVTKGFKEHFKEFHDFSLNCGLPMASILVTNREECRRCKKLLVVDGKPRVVVIYHIFLGTYLGCRISKCCRRCKIYEHYGFWMENGERYFEEDFENMDFLMSSEETVFDMSLMRENASLLVMGALPFRTFAASYNRRFGYGTPQSKVKGSNSKAKRMKRFVCCYLLSLRLYLLTLQKILHIEVNATIGPQNPNDLLSIR